MKAPPLTGCYINLDRAVQRRERMEVQIARSDLAGIVRRMPAIDGDAGVPVVTGLKPPEVGCALSHERAILAGSSEAFQLVMEDDVLLPPDLGARLGHLLTHIPQEWDLLLLNMMVNFRRGAQVRTLMQMWKSLRELPGNRYQLLDAGTYFAYMTAAYVVHPRSRLRTLLAGGHSWRKPFDVEVRDWLQAGQLKGYVAFPFLVGINPDHPSQLDRAEDSQSFHAAATNLFWRDGDIAEIEQLMPAPMPETDAERRARLASRMFYQLIR